MKKILIVLGLIMAVWACKDETKQIPAEEEEYSTYALTYQFQEELDSSYAGNPFYRLYTDVFKGRGCADGGCHDGSFEPDFRTLFSAYNTLVYHPVVKSNAEGTFVHRAVPYDLPNSWLMERVTTDDPVLGRMPLYSQPLSDDHLTQIRNWINAGCPDEFGNLPNLPNPEPVFFGLLAYLDNNQSGQELSDTRGAEFFYPLNLPQNETIEFWIGLYDLTPEGDFVLGGEITEAQYQISSDLYNFDGVPLQALDVLPLGTPFMGPILGSTDEGPYYHSFTINTADFTPGELYGFRVVVKGKNNAAFTTFPDDDSPLFFKSLFSFQVDE